MKLAPLSYLRRIVKPKNKKIYTGDLVTLQAEYTSMGFDTSLDGGVLTVYTVRRKKEKTDKKKR